MSKVSEFVAKIDNEFKAREDTIAKEKAEVAEVKKDNAAKARKLTEREKAIEAKLADISTREGEIAKVENILAREKALVSKNVEAEQKLGRVKEINDQSNEKLAEAKQKLLEQAKRERALTDRESKYRDKIKREVLKKFLNE